MYARPLITPTLMKCVFFALSGMPQRTLCQSTQCHLKTVKACFCSLFSYMMGTLYVTVFQVSCKLFSQQKKRGFQETYNENVLWKLIEHKNTKNNNNKYSCKQQWRSQAAQSCHENLKSLSTQGQGHGFNHSQQVLCQLPKDWLRYWWLCCWFHLVVKFILVWRPSVANFVKTLWPVKSF